MSEYGCHSHTSESSIDLWKHGLVAPEAVVTDLPIADLAQWVCFVFDRWQGKSLRCAR